MSPLIPVLTLFLAIAFDRPRARRRQRLEPPDSRWLDLEEKSSDLAVMGMDPMLLEWLIGLARQSGAMPLLDGRGKARLEKKLRHIDGIRVEVDPETGFWAVRQGPWLIQTEPWGSECMIGSPIAPYELPSRMDEQVSLYAQEAERRRFTTREGVPSPTARLMADIWLPAARLRPNPLGVDYQAVQVSIWHD